MLKGKNRFVWYQGMFIMNEQWYRNLNSSWDSLDSSLDSSWAWAALSCGYMDEPCQCEGLMWAVTVNLQRLGTKGSIHLCHSRHYSTTCWDFKSEIPNIHLEQPTSVLGVKRATQEGSCNESEEWLLQAAPKNQKPRKRRNARELVNNGCCYRN